MFKLEHPIYALHDPTGRTFFLEQPGRVRLYANGKLDETPYLDISKKVYMDYECGLESIAFHPKFAENGYFYACYTIDLAPKPAPVTQPSTGPARGRRGRGPVVPYHVRMLVVEYHVDPKATHVDDSSERVLLTQEHITPIHKGGQLQFGPDGYLYIGFGDGGPQADGRHNGQNLNVFLAKMLRIDVSPREGYAIPKDNPLVGREGVKQEIFAWGLRNVWRFSFDRETGLLFGADVGQDTWEELNLVANGGNYGWSIREGAHDFHTDRPNAGGKMIDPIFEYNHDRTAASITGGYVYRGKQIPELRGWYLCGDYSQGFFYGLKIENGAVTASGKIVDPHDPTRTGGLRRPSQPASFGEDADGELYMLDANGPIYKVVGDTAK